MILQNEQVVLFIETINKLLNNPVAGQYMNQYRSFYSKVGKVLDSPKLIEALELAAAETDLEKLEFTFNREVTLEEAVDATINRLTELREQRESALSEIAKTDAPLIFEDKHDE